MTARRAICAASMSLAIGVAGGCSGPTVVEPEPIPADYTDWVRVDTTGDVPGHGDTYRIIYVNATGAEYVGAGPYAAGTVIVKEVHDLDGDQPGDLQYIAVMRKLAAPPDGGELQGFAIGNASGWLFTSLADSIDSDEENDLSCYDSCHWAAPLDHTFHSFAQ